MPRTTSPAKKTSRGTSRSTSGTRKSGTTRSASAAGKSGTKKTTKRSSKTTAAAATTKKSTKKSTAKSAASKPSTTSKKKTTKKATTKKTTRKKSAPATDAVAEAAEAPVEPVEPVVDPQEDIAAKAKVLEAASRAAPVTKPAAKRGRGATTVGDIPIEDLWVAYKKGPTEEMRNLLIENYLEVVRYTAERMHTRLPGEVDIDDLMSAGLFGLFDAIDAFDLERGVKFETYCAQRIRGAIFDHLRSMDWVPRLVRSRTAKVERARKSLEMELGRKPTDQELSGRLNVDNAEYEKLTKDSRPVGVVSLNRKWFETDSSKDVREIDVIKDNRQENPLNEIQRKDLRLLITKGLSRAERLIVVLYYYEEMTMKEIGVTLDLSESRVSQMHSSILARLKAQMQHREKEF